MDNDNHVADREMLLAEYNALRAEILQRTNLRWTIFALQLTAAGAVFGFTLSNRSHIGFLLILPVISYALTARFVIETLAIRSMGTYIREFLEKQTKGSLHWQMWIETDRPPRPPILNWANPNFLVFPGPAVLALVWVAPYVWESHASAVKRVLIVIIWFVGIIVTLLSIQLIKTIQSKFWKSRKSATAASTESATDASDTELSVFARTVTTVREYFPGKSARYASRIRRAVAVSPFRVRGAGLCSCCCLRRWHLRRREAA